MVECNFCEENSPMPYKCSLCNHKYCGKHRLAESHECKYIHLYNTQEYRDKKLAKNRDISQIKHSTWIPDTDKPNILFMGGQKGWTTNKLYQDLIIGGIILGFVATLRVGLNNIILNLIISILIGSIGLMLINWARQKIGYKFGVNSYFFLWPLGIVITILTTLLDAFTNFGFTLMAFGLFYTVGQNTEGEGKMGLITYITSISLFLLGKIIFELNFIDEIIRIPMHSILTLFLWLAIFSLFPWQGMDGRKIYDWNKSIYWTCLVIVLFFFFFA
ncbi:MAG: AN1-type zinc finger domain-containing protein [Candidatus Heimdallarchaeota archaeon]|nr:AN1-type zinc finger domain-containing protein [Candidatus Heimdallarchaeota archaeon]